MKQIKIFSGSQWESVEEKVNTYLETLNHNLEKISDIQFSVSQSTERNQNDPEFDDARVIFSVMIVFEEHQ